MNQNNRDIKLLNNIEFTVRLIAGAMEEMRECIKNNPLDDNRYAKCKNVEEELDTSILPKMVFLSTPPEIVEALRRALNNK